jgi:cob(I)alamin adenosyltransferase
MSGRIIVFTGDGKGKTTAAFGMALRAAGHGRRVVVIQFLKARPSGEVKVENRNIEVYQFGHVDFVRSPDTADIEKAAEGMRCAHEALTRRPFLLVLDEVNVAVHLGLIDEGAVGDLLDLRGETHVILTGRNAPRGIQDRADILTRMENVRHCFDAGDGPIEGLEY